MLFKIDYTKRNDKSKGTELIDFVEDSTRAVKRFMNKFFEDNPSDAVRIESVRQIEVIGDGAIPL